MKTWKPLLGCALLGASLSAQATVIDTAGAWDQEHAAFPFGNPNTATFGQTFRVGSDNVLKRFSFFLDDLDGSAPVAFRIYVAAWDGQKAVAGSERLVGGGSTTGANGFEAFDVDMGNLTLNVGGEYVVFLSIDADLLAESEAFLGTLEEDRYMDGDLVLMNNGADFGQLFSQAWSYWYDSDMAFRLEFAAVPEPWTLGLMGAGLLGLGGLRRRAR